MSLAISASFEYLCYVSMANIVCLFLSVWGSSLERQNLTSKDCPRAGRVTGEQSAANRLQA